MSAPLVSCVMPTRNRPAFLPLAMRWFDRQDWPNRELIIVHGGPAPLPEYLLGRTDVRWLNAPEGASLGAQRNLGVGSAEGEVIVSWDDDDWFAPDRISRQAAPLVSGKMDYDTLTVEYIHEVSSARTWRLLSRTGRPSGGLAMGTVAFHHRVWDRGLRFGDANAGEDWMFVMACREAGLRFRLLTPQGDWLYLRHRANTFAFERQPGWRPAAPPRRMPQGALEDLRRAALATAPEGSGTPLAGGPSPDTTGGSVPYRTG